MHGLIVARRRAGTRTVGLARTTRAVGDLRVDGESDALAARRRAVARALLATTAAPDGVAVDERSWAWLRQVHGAQVVVVRAGQPLPAGDEADALVTDRAGVLLAVHTADCAPVSFVDDAAGVVGIAHAGWRGLAAGVLDRTLDAMAALGAEAPSAVLGPCIHASCYAFGADDLDAVAAELGDVVRGETATGAPALDLPAAVRAALARRGVPVDDTSTCTACDAADWFSHRARGEVGRMAHLTWIEP